MYDDGLTFYALRVYGIFRRPSYWRYIKWVHLCSFDVSCTKNILCDPLWVNEIFLFPYTVIGGVNRTHDDLCFKSYSTHMVMIIPYSLTIYHILHIYVFDHHLKSLLNSCLFGCLISDSTIYYFQSWKNRIGMYNVFKCFQLIIVRQLYFRRQQHCPQ